MRTHILHRSILVALLAGTPFSCSADFSDWASNNASHLAWGTGTLLVAGVTYLIADNNSNNKYAYLTKQAELGKETADEERARNEQLKQDRKATDERIALELAQDFLQSFNALIEKFGSTPPEQLTKNEEFQRSLLALVLGSNANPQRLNELNNTVAHIKTGIYAISNPNLSNEKKKILDKLNFILQQANNSSDIHSVQHDLTREQLELEHAKHMKQISAERAMLAHIETESSKKVCVLNEQAAEETAQAARSANQTAQKIIAVFNRATGNIEGQLKIIGNDLNAAVKNGFDQLSEWQAARALEHAETRSHYTHIAALIPALANALGSAQNSMHHQSAQLSRIEGKLDQNKETAEKILAHLPTDSRIALEKYIAHTAYESEQRILKALAQALNPRPQAAYAPSAPPMERPEFE